MRSFRTASPGRLLTSSLLPVVGYTATATDKAGRSIPACVLPLPLALPHRTNLLLDSPGRGVLGTAREVASKYPTQILDISYRKRQLEFRRTQISAWLTNETDLLKLELESRPASAEKLPADYISERLASIESEAKRQESEAMGTFGMLSGSDPSVSPLRRALAVWGLTVDDIGVASVSFRALGGIWDCH